VRYRIAIAAMMLSIGSFARADVRLPSILSDNMVLQQKAAVSIWGWAGSPAASLYNGANLPASPFRTDDWPGVSRLVK